MPQGRAVPFRPMPRPEFFRSEDVAKVEMQDPCQYLREQVRGDQEPIKRCTAPGEPFLPMS